MYSWLRTSLTWLILPSSLRTTSLFFTQRTIRALFDSLSGYMTLFPRPLIYSNFSLVCLSAYSLLSLLRLVVLRCLNKRRGALSCTTRRSFCPRWPQSFTGLYSTRRGLSARYSKLVSRGGGRGVPLASSLHVSLRECKVWPVICDNFLDLDWHDLISPS